MPLPYWRVATRSGNQDCPDIVDTGQGRTRYQHVIRRLKIAVTVMGIGIITRIRWRTVIGNGRA